MTTVSEPAILCPPLCPGVLGTDLPVVPATPTSLQRLDLLNNITYTFQPFASSSVTSVSGSGGGVLYLSTCVGDYTDPTATSACSNASDPRSLKCAYGQGDACIPCPRGALCPGGYHARPLPGYWSADETTPNVIQCKNPSSRCTGYDILLGMSGCAVGYSPISIACSSCAPDYYPLIDGTCVECPNMMATSKLQSIMILLEPLFIFIGCLLGGAVAVILIMYGIIKFWGGTIKNGLYLTVTFIIWLFNCVQVMSQATLAASPGLPPILQSYLNVVSLFLFTGLTGNPACAGPNGPFIFTNFEFGLVLLLQGLLILLMIQHFYFNRGNVDVVKVDKQVTCSNWFSRNKGGMFYILFAVLSLVYPLIANSVLSLLACSTVPMTPRAYLLLDGDGTTLLKNGIPASYAADMADLMVENVVDPYANMVIPVSVLTKDPFIVCYEGVHKIEAYYGIFMMIWYLLLFPIATLTILLTRMHAILMKHEPQYEEYLMKQRIYRAQYLEKSVSCWQRFRRRIFVSMPIMLSHSLSERDLRREESLRDLLKLNRSSSRNLLEVSNPMLLGPKSSGSNSSLPITDSSTDPNKIPQVARTALLKKKSSRFVLKSISELPNEKTGSMPEILDKDPVHNSHDFIRMIDNCQELKQDVILRFFTSGDFRASKAFFRHVDILLLACMSCILTLWAHPSSVYDAGMKLLTTLVCIFTIGFFIWYVNPYKMHERWKYYVKLLSLFITMWISILYFLSYSSNILAPQVADDQYRTSMLLNSSSNSQTSTTTSSTSSTQYNLVSAPIVVIAYLVVILITIMFLVLFIEFWLSLRRELVLEQKKIVADKIAHEHEVHLVPSLSIRPPTPGDIFQSQEDVETSTTSPSQITSSYHYLIRSYRERNAPIPSAITSLFPEAFAVENPLRENLKRFSSAKSKTSVKNVLGALNTQASSRKMSMRSRSLSPGSPHSLDIDSGVDYTSSPELDPRSVPSTPLAAQRLKRVGSDGFDVGGNSFRITDKKFLSAQSTRFPNPPTPLQSGRDHEHSMIPTSGEGSNIASPPVTPKRSIFDFYKPMMTRKS
jgi:hypothetical protein